MKTININPERPVEELTGDNWGITRIKLNRLHISTSILQAARESRPTNMRQASPALRRGWALCVIKTMQENLGFYNHIMFGTS